MWGLGVKREFTETVNKLQWKGYWHMYSEEEDRTGASKTRIWDPNGPHIMG